MRLLLVVASALLVVTSDASAASTRRSQVRAVAHRYLVAVAHGDGRVACGLLSARGLRDGGYASRAACARDYSRHPLRRVFPILRITFPSRRVADVIVGDAAISDSGNDMIELHQYGRRWLIDAG